MKRIVVIGTTGTGKTTLASQLAKHLGYAHVELDALFWEPNWTEAETAVFRERVKNALEVECWVVDGNYTSKVIDIVWPRADTLIWLDYTLPVTMWRLVLRTMRRAVTKERLWSGNRESLRKQLFSDQSLILWALKSHGRLRRELSELLSQPEHAYLQVVRLHAPRETREWLMQLTKKTGGSQTRP